MITGLTEICKEDISLGSAIVMAACIAAFCFVMWLFLKD